MGEFRNINEENFNKISENLNNSEEELSEGIKVKEQDPKVEEKVILDEVEKKDQKIKEEDEIEKKEDEIKEDQANKKSIHDDLKNLNKEDLIKRYEKLLKENEKLKHTIREKDKLIEEITKDKSEYLDKYKRSLAEMENLRKRTVVEKQESLRYANFNIISDLLVILDDFNRAIDSGKSGITDLNNYIQGIEMIEKHFLDLLFKKYGVKKYGESGEEFNPTIHQALMMEEGDFDKEIVIELFRNGYMLHDRVIRPAQVKVGKPKN